MKTIFGMILTVTLLFSCAHYEQSLTTNWSAGMSSMAQSYKDLLPFLYNTPAYSHPTNKYAVRSSLENIASGSAAVSDHIRSKVSEEDPFYRIGLNNLRLATTHALKNFDKGQFPYSQTLAQSSLSYCVQCHMRTAEGPEITLWTEFSIPKNTPLFEEIQILMATRQFSKAESALTTNVLENAGQTSAQKLEAFKTLLTLAVKHRRSPDRVLATMDEFFSTKNYKDMPGTSKNLLQQWKSALLSWKSVISSGSDIKLSGLLAKPTTWPRGSQEGFVLALRKSRVLHKGLESTKPHDKRAYIYDQLGQIYYAFPEIGLFGASQTYFESCIRLHPHSPTARKCYKGWADAIADERLRTVNSVFYHPQRQKTKELERMSSKQVNAGPRQK